jgi:hypothetical protein
MTETDILYTSEPIPNHSEFEVPAEPLSLLHRMKDRIAHTIYEHTYQGHIDEYWQKHEGIVDYVTSGTDLYTLKQKIHQDADRFAKGQITKDALTAITLIGAIVGGGIYLKNKEWNISTVIKEIPDDLQKVTKKTEQWKKQIISSIDRFLLNRGNAIGEGIMGTIQKNAPDLAVDLGEKAGEAASIGIQKSLPDWLLAVTNKIFDKK